MTQKFIVQKTHLLAGKHALVTGGAKGIGAAIARTLLGHGARVTIVGRTESTLRETAQEFSPYGETSTEILDVTNAAAVSRVFELVRVKNGPVTILVNNAGQGESAPFLKMDQELWRRMFSVNLDGTFFCSQAALPGMLETGWGRIINIASTAGLTGYRYVSAYCASKHAVIGLTRSLALEVATKGVTVNAICPGYTDTDMVANAITQISTKTGRSAKAARTELVSKNPQERLVQPEEVASTAAWLCLPGSDAITGQAIAVAGGEVM